MSGHSIPSICVYCGARNGSAPPYVGAARALGEGLAARGHRLIYGAGEVGLMGEVAQAARRAGAATLGVVPQHLLRHEGADRRRDDVIVTETMHERKKVMFVNADAVVVLPGGAGTLDEFFEVLTWRQLGLHRKPIFLLDVAGYWAPLAALIDHVIAHGFAEPSLRGFVTVVPDVPALMQALDGLGAGDVDVTAAP